MSYIATTLDGIAKRYIDNSSPWSQGYLCVDGTITNFSEVRESFSLKNIITGSELDPDWFELF